MAKVVKKALKKPIQKKSTLKNLGGRPAHFENENNLQKKIDEYFQYIQGDYKDITLRDEEGNPYVERKYTRRPEQATITGMAIFIGFESRQSVYDYEKSGKFSYIIKRARLYVENAYEQALMSERPTGAIFALKNMGWTDKQEIDHTTKGDSINPTPITFTKGSNG